MNLMRGRVAVVAGLCAVALAGCKKNEETRPPDASAGADTGPAEQAETKPEEAEESPYLDVSNFNRKVEEHLPEIVACYKETVGKQPDAPTGRVKSTIVVDGDGKVKKVTFDDQRSTLKDPALFSCMEGKIKAWRFNITLTGADSPMPYGFELRQGELLKD